MDLKQKYWAGGGEETMESVTTMGLQGMTSNPVPHSLIDIGIPVAPTVSDQNISSSEAANGAVSHTTSPLNAAGLGRQIAATEMTHKLSSQALLNMNGSRFMRNIAQLEVCHAEDSLDDSVKELMSIRSLLHDDSVYAGEKEQGKKRHGSIGVVVEGGREDVISSQVEQEFPIKTTVPLISDSIGLDTIPDRRVATLEQMLRDASQARGIKLSWLIYGIFSVVFLMYLLLLGLVQIVVTNDVVLAEEEVVQMSSSSAVSQLEWLHYSTKNLLESFHLAKISQRGADDEIFLGTFCMAIGGAPLVLAGYDAANNSLLWTVNCPAAASLGITPPPSLEHFNTAYACSFCMAVYKSDFIIAMLKPINHTGSLAVILQKKPVGRLLLANSIPTYSSSTLKQSSTAFLMPDFYTFELVVALHSLNMEFMNYTVRQPTFLGQKMYERFHTVCELGKAHTWHAVIHPTSDEHSLVWENEAGRLANVMPKPHVEYTGLWGRVKLVLACGVFCVEPHADLCATGNPTSTWFVVSNEPLNRETEVALSAVAFVSIAAALLFLFILIIAYVSITVPVQYLKSLIFHALGEKGVKIRRDHLLFQYTKSFWLGDMQALVRAFQLLSFCFRLNKKYVPQHILEQQALALQNRKDRLWRTIVVEAEEDEDDDEDDDVDGEPSGNDREDMEMFVNTVSAMDGITAMGVFNAREAVSHSFCGKAWGDNSIHALPTVDVDVGDMSASIGTAYNIDVVGCGMTIVEAATILSVHLCAVELAYFSNYGVAVKQHRRIMNFLLGRVRYYRGELFERSGDCISATWNAFESRADHACRAASCALSIAKFLTPYRQAGFRVGIVLHQGPFVCGVVQDNKEAFTTVFGAVPRQAVALAELAASLPYFNVLVSEPVKQTLSSHFECIMVDVIKYHEDDTPIVMFELSEERRIPPVKGTPTAPSAFAEEHARVFFNFRNHKFDRALEGVRQLRINFPRTGECLLRRIELLCQYYRQHANELPLPYFRPYPTWPNYEAIANMDTVPDPFANGFRDDNVFDVSRFVRLSRSTYDDDAVRFRQDLHDNMVASRRMNSPGYLVKPLEVGSVKKEADSSSPTRSATNECQLKHPPVFPLHSTEMSENVATGSVREALEIAAEVDMTVVSNATTSTFWGQTVPLSKAETLQYLQAEKWANGAVDWRGKDGGMAATAEAVALPLPLPLPPPGVKAENEEGTMRDGDDNEREGGAMMAIAPIGNVVTEQNSVLSVRTPTEVVTDNNNDDDEEEDKGVHSDGPKHDGRQRFSFTNRLATTVIEGCTRSLVGGTESCVSFNSEMIHNAPSISFRDLEGSLTRVAYELPTEIVANNGITYLRSSRVLGKGSFGCVYLGMDVHSGRMVAIKFLPLPSEEEGTTNAETEVLTMQKVKSTHVVEFISYALQSSLIIIIMECMMAGSLQGMISAFDSIPGATARLFIRDVLRGLHKLHSMGVIHRDVKPQNVLLTLAGNCKISDFGASAFLHELVRKQMEGKGLQVLGTPVYLAPEAARGTPEEKSDIWSCGIMFIQLVEGALPYEKTFLQMPPQVLVYQIGSGAAKPIIPTSLDEFEAEFVRNCLKENPNERLSAKHLLELPMFAL